MPRILVVIAVLLLAIGGWYLAWHRLMADDVAQVRASIAYHDRAIKARASSMTLKADDVYASGFPFSFTVVVERPTLTQIWNRETYALSLLRLELQKVNDGEGRYRVKLPAMADAMYATEGQAPERYQVKLNEVPAVLLRAQADSRACPNLPGSPRCDAVEPTAPLRSFAVQLPKNLTLDVTLNGQQKQIGFTFMPINVPVFMTIPDDASGPLQLFVGMLREAMIFHH